MTAQNPPATEIALAGIEVRLSPPGHYRMGLIWEKLWKWTEVAGKAG